MKKFSYKPVGVCSVNIDIELEGDIIGKVDFSGGCNGNLKGLSVIVQGMPVREVIEKLKGIDCGGRGTSCPDQLAKALNKFLETV